MNSHLIIFHLLTVLSCGTVLYRNQTNGILETMGRIGTLQFPVQFEISSYNFIPGNFTQSELDVDITFETSFEDPIHLDSSVLSEALSLADFHSTWIFGISPSSSFVRLFGPLSLVSAEVTGNHYQILYRNSSYETFQSKCIANSTTDFYQRSEQYVAGALVSLEFMGRMTEQFYLQFQSIEHNVVMRVSHQVVDDIREILFLHGATETEAYSGAFTNCSSEMVERLAHLTLNFLSETTNHLYSQLIVDPIDYVYIDREEEKCYLLLQAIPPGSHETPSIDLTKLQGLNLHITPNSVSICDSI